MVEEPDEILADKVVASIDRLARRGTLKTTDLYDIWFLRVRLAVPPADRSLVQAKIADYGIERRHPDLSAAVHAVSREELRSVLAGVLPAAELEVLRDREVLDVAAVTLQEASDAP